MRRKRAYILWRGQALLTALMLSAYISGSAYSHEPGGEKDIRCSVTYGTEAETDIYGINKIEGGETYYTLTVTPAISMTFLNSHVDIGILPENACTPLPNDQKMCIPWELSNPDMAPSLQFVAETKNGLQITGKYAVLNFQEPPQMKPHPINHVNSIYITKEQYLDAERQLNYCTLIY